MSHAVRTTPTSLAVDLVVALLVGSLATWLVQMGPPHLPVSDAGLLVLDATRLLQGSVPFRDFETFATPGTLLVQAAAFRWFGWSVEVTYGLHAALQGLLASAVYLIARRLGVRPPMATFAATAQLAVGYWIWAGISAHWFGAVGLALVVLGLSFDWLSGSLWRNLGQGVLIGLFTCLQHQKGLLSLPLLAAYLLIDAWLAGRLLARPGDVFRRAGALALGFLLVVAVSLGPLIAVAGWSATVDGLLTSPLTRYKRWNVNQLDFSVMLELFRIAWIVDEPNLSATGIRKASVVLALTVGVIMGLGAAALRGRAQPENARRWLLAVFYCGVAQATSGYRLSVPSYQAFAAPAAAVGLALIIDGSLARWIPARFQPWRAIAGITGSLLMAWSAWDTSRLSGAYWFPAKTHFGTIATSSTSEAELIERAVQAVRAVTTGALYCHTYCPEANLLFGLDNPTPRTFLIPGFHTPEEFAAMKQVLAARRDPIIATGAMATLNGGDPVLDWIEAEYVRAPSTLPTRAGFAGSILLRKDLAALFRQLRDRQPIRPPAPAP